MATRATQTASLRFCMQLLLPTKPANSRIAPNENRFPSPSAFYQQGVPTYGIPPYSAAYRSGSSGLGGFTNSPSLGFAVPTVVSMELWMVHPLTHRRQSNLPPLPAQEQKKTTRSTSKQNRICKSGSTAASAQKGRGRGRKKSNVKQEDEASMTSLPATNGPSALDSVVSAALAASEAPASFAGPAFSQYGYPDYSATNMPAGAFGANPLVSLAAQVAGTLAPVPTAVPNPDTLGKASSSTAVAAPARLLLRRRPLRQLHRASPRASRTATLESKAARMRDLRQVVQPKI